MYCARLKFGDGGRDCAASRRDGVENPGRGLEGARPSSTLGKAIPPANERSTLAKEDVRRSVLATPENVLLTVSARLRLGRLVTGVGGRAISGDDWRDWPRVCEAAADPR